MAARYVNPDNITAQGQYFYTGLPPGSYDSQGGGGASNVYGAGSGGSAGVSADRTGSDSSKTWKYASNWAMNLGRTNWKMPGKRKPAPEGGIIDDPPESPPPIDPGKRRKPVSNGGPLDAPHFPVVSGRERWLADGQMVRLGPNEVDPMAPVDPAGPFGKKPLQLGPGPSNQGPDPYVSPEKVEFPGGNEWEKWEKRSDSAKAGASGRKRPDRKMPAKDFTFGMEALANADGIKGMWGAFTSSSASRAHSRPRTF